MASNPALALTDLDRDDREGRDRRHRTWLISTAVAIIVISLSALVIVPILVERRAETIERRIIAINAADVEVRELQSALVQQLSNAALYEVAQDTTYLRMYRDGRRAELRALSRFEPLVAELPDPVIERFRESVELIQRWHGALGVNPALGEPLAVPSAADPGLARSYHEAAVRSLDVLRGLLGIAAQRGNAQVAAAERLGLWVGVGLAVLALFSTALVVLLGQRLSAVAQQARRKSQELLRIQEARTRLLRGMTHDLKNPLGAAALYGELLEMGVHGDLQPKQRHVVERIGAALQQALGLVTDLLDLAQAEEGLLKLHPTPIEVQPLLARLVDDLSGPAMAGKLTLELQVEGDIPAIEADPVRMRQILDNLVGNALKYTPPDGRVMVRLRTDREGPRPNRDGWVAIEVTDTGPGIAPAEFERVFEEFVRLGEGGPAGSGVGLAISRQLARLMQGEITLKSVPGKGSTFTLWMPLGPVW